MQEPEQVQINYSKKVSNKKMSKITSFTKKPAGILLVLLVIALGGFGYYFQKYNAVAKNPAAESAQKAEEAKKKTEEVVSQISKLIMVTDSTNAVLATIADKSKLSGQKFFDLAENGDELVLFPNMQKAVIYRPSVNKIIDVGPFNPNAQASSTPATTTKATSKTTTASSTKAK